MQTTANSSAKSFTELFTAIIMGLMVGAITTLFIRCLELIAIEQLALNTETWPLHVFFIPIVLVFLYLLKKQTLYFPVKVSELTSWKLDTMVHWNPLMSLYHFFGYRFIV